MGYFLVIMNLAWGVTLTFAMVQVAQYLLAGLSSLATILAIYALFLTLKL